MRRNCLIILAVASLALWACQHKEAIETSAPADTTFEYPIEKTFYGLTDFKAKTVLNYENILWESNDTIKILWGEGLYNKAVAKPFNSGLNAEFTTTVEQAEDYYGVYPHSAVSSLTRGHLCVTVPSVQTGTFAEANIAVAKADADNNMVFKHVVSFLEFTIDRTGLLTFADGVSDKIAGVVKVSGFANDETPVYDVEADASEVTLDIRSSGTYYIALLPDVKIDMLSFTLKADDKEYYILTTNPVQMTPGKLVGLGNITDKFTDSRPLGAMLESFTIVEFQFDQSF